MDGIGVAQVTDVFYLDHFDGNAHVSGTLHLTLSHIIFIGSSRKQEIWLLNQLIGSAERRPLTTGGAPLVIHSKDYRVIRLMFTRERDCHNVCLTIKRLGLCNHISELPCFRLVPPDCYWNRSDGWDSHEMTAQLSRFGLPNTAWTLTDINDNFQVCDSYPTVLCVPSSVSNSILIGSSRFRSRGRFPVLTYLHPNGKSALCRSSQPLAGFSSRCIEDQLLLDAIRLANPTSSLLYVVDTRPALNALTNKAQGKGYEDATVYRNISIHFFDIENIHVVRGSLEKLLKACQDSTLTPEAFASGLEKSGWLRHLRAILEAAYFIVSRLSEGSSVLVHCSDGWDRTSQVCSLAQIILDPYYRTISGLQALIKKDWLLFGHKFSDRCQLLSSGDSREVSPIFTQFLDCVRHLVELCPAKFEYNTSLLRMLHDEVYAATYGTFVGCSEQERRDLRLSQRSYSLWPLIDRQLHSHFRNPYYEHCEFLIQPRLHIACEPEHNDNNHDVDDNSNDIDHIAQGVELMTTATGSDRAAVDTLPAFVLAPQLFQVWRGLFLRWEWRLPRPDLHRLECLSDVLRRQVVMASHRRLLLLRIAQLCRTLGRPLLTVLPTVDRKLVERMLLQQPGGHVVSSAVGSSVMTDEPLRQYNNSVNLTPLTSPSPLLSPIMSSIRSNDPFVHSNSYPPVHGDEDVLNLLSRHFLGVASPLPSPSDAQLTTELASVCTQTTFPGYRRGVATCPICGILFALAEPISHCHVCGWTVCSRCTSKKPHCLPGLPLSTASCSSVCVCLTCSSKPNISGAKPCLPSYRPAVANARVADGPLLDPLVSVVGQG